MCSAGAALAAAVQGEARLLVSERAEVKSITSFDLASQVGWGRETIMPGDAKGQSLLISGEPGAAFAIVLPPIAFLTSALANEQPITLRDFQTPLTTARLDMTGAFVVHVGLTRDPLSKRHHQVAYSGVYTVTIVY